MTDIVPTSLRPLLGLAAFGLAYFLLALGGLLMAGQTNQISAIWPASAMALAVMLRNPPSRWAAYLAVAYVAGVLADLTTGSPLGFALGLGVGDLLDIVVALFLVRKYCGLPVTLGSLREAVWFFALAAGVAPVFGATVGAAVVHYTFGDPYIIQWATWWTSTAVGVVVVSPLCLTWRAGLLHDVPIGRIIEAAGLGVAIVAFSALAYLSGRYPLLFLVLPVLLWAAVRFGPFGASLTGLVLTGIGLWSLLAGRLGTLNGATLNEDIVFLQLFLIVAILPAILVAVVIAERERAEQTLRASEGNLAAAQRIAQMGSYERNLYTGDVIWSDETFRIFGIEPGRASPNFEECMRIVHPDDRDKIRTLITSGVDRESPYSHEFRIVRPDGAERILADHGELVFGQDGKIERIFGTLQDVTETRQAERALREQEQMLASIAANLPGPVFRRIQHPDGRMTYSYISERLSEIFDVDHGDAMRDIENMLSAVHPDDRERVREAAEDAARDRRPYRLDFRMVGRSGGSKWARVTVRPTPLEDGSVIWDGVLLDIDQEKQQEEQLIQAQKMEAVGQLTGGIAHDFNNRLLVISGNLERIRERVRDDDELRDWIDRAIAASDRSADLTHRLLAFSRRQSLQPRPVDLNRMIHDMADLLRRSLGEAVEIEIVGAAGLWPCFVDPAQMENALLNLAINARDAMPEGGKLTIETANMRLDDEYAAAQAEVNPGQYVMLAVADTGTGMSRGVIEQAFDPFFTTKPVGQGSGLGLSMIYGFVKQSGGHAKIYSEEGIGTTVRLYLPRATTTDEPIDERPSTSEDLSARGETVLVVEDDPDVRTLAVALLSGLGYQVVEAANGESALALLENHPRVNLLFTDVVLPGGMSGRVLAEEASRRYQGIAVLYMSGYTENAIVHHGRLDEGVQLLQKPFRRDELARKVRLVLDRNRD